MVMHGQLDGLYDVENIRIDTDIICFHIAVSLNLRLIVVNKTFSTVYVSSKIWYKYKCMLIIIYNNVFKVIQINVGATLIIYNR